MFLRVLPLLEPLLPLFVEDPVLPEFSCDLGAVVRSTVIPLTNGERLYSRWGWRSVLSAQALEGPKATLSRSSGRRGPDRTI
ncbi:enolase C-terminal domain-like protein [Streptomyces sp. NPDC050211]|uniref:enolase C-terminal domain-like protein n=1 Tax=Streptomyces sp. NPDC050211 TaxID=3154932 RepID=UPI003428DDF3